MASPRLEETALSSQLPREEWGWRGPESLDSFLTALPFPSLAFAWRDDLCSHSSPAPGKGGDGEGTKGQHQCPPGNMAHGQAGWLAGHLLPVATFPGTEVLGDSLGHR